MKHGIVRGLRARFILRRAEAKRIAERCAAKVIAAVQRRRTLRAGAG